LAYEAITPETYILLIKLEVVIWPRCENESTRSMGLPPIETEQ